SAWRMDSGRIPVQPENGSRAKRMMEEISRLPADGSLPAGGRRPAPGCGFRTRLTALSSAHGLAAGSLLGRRPDAKPKAVSEAGSREQGRQLRPTTAADRQPSAVGRRKAVSRTLQSAPDRERQEAHAED